MPTLTSELIAKLTDKISAPATKAGAALDRLKRKAGTAGSPGLFGRMNERAADTARSLLAFGGAAGAAAFATKSYREFAEYDRRMTRIGITAEATGQEVADATKKVRDIANDTGLGIGAVTDGLDSLTAAGRNMKDALAFLPSVAQTAQASGAEVAHIASSADALGSNMKVTAGEMQQAFDVLAKAGKLGKFELRDMAQSLPAVASAAAAAGLTGLDGTRKVAAALQTVRMDTGDASSAANNLLNVFQKMGSTETEKKFAKMGVKNFRKEFDAARKSGKDMLEWILDASQKATKGDLGKIPLLFNDAQVQAGIRSLLAHREQFKQYSAEIRNSAGTVAADLKKVQGDAASTAEKLANSWTALSQAVGRGLDAAGVTSQLNSIAKATNQAADGLDRLTKNFSEKGPIGGLYQTVVDNNEIRKNDPKSTSLIPGMDSAWVAENKRLKAIADQRIDDSDDMRHQQIMLDKERARYQGGVAAGTATDKSRQIYFRAQATAEAAMADIRRRLAAEKDAALRELVARGEKGLAAEHPDFVPSRTKDDFIYPMRGGKEVLGPQIPPKPAPAVPQPPPRPTEIAPVAPKVDTTGIDQAQQLLQSVNDKIAELNGTSAAVSVTPQGMDEAISKLTTIKSLMNQINNGSVRVPSGGSSHGAYHDVDVY